MNKFDQAEGLRRLLEQPKIKMFTILSAMSDVEKSSMMINLSDSLAREGKNTLMIDLRSTTSSLGSWMEMSSSQTLLEVAKQSKTLDSVIKKISPFLCITQLFGSRYNLNSSTESTQRELSKVFDRAVSRSDCVVIDGELDANDTFIISSLEESEIVIQVSTDPSTIKKAYLQIKKLNEKTGCKQFGIIISGGKGQQAQQIFSNLVHTANRYLAVQLNLIGVIPNDSHFKKAIELGRTVNDVFPSSLAANAFNEMAKKLISSTQTSLSFQTMATMGAQIEY